VKPTARLLGFDDGPFTFEDETAALAGVLSRPSGYVEAVLLDEITVDGTDATRTVLDLLEGSGLVETAAAVAFDGGAVGGFNVVDLAEVHETLDVPAVAVLREEPDEAAVREALAQHVDGARERGRVLTREPLHEVDLGDGVCYVRHAGGSLDEVAALLAEHTVRGRTPEPVRVAHLVATAAAEGASRGA
jgi:endonuclease V-like protein UPF0215 family